MRRWNDDPYTKKARRENFQARSVYKLEEIDQRERVLQGVKTVLDLGASPGSWTEYCLRKLPQARIVAVDLAPLRVNDPRVTFLQTSIEGLDLAPAIGPDPVDIVLSDMAPKTSGIHDRDVALSTELATLALDAARKHLKKGGNFVVKLFMGDTFEDFNKTMKQEFQTVRILRPESTRKHSREAFFIGKGFKNGR